MQDLCLVPSLAALAARLARTSNHPEVETPSAPAAVSFSKSRRESCSRNMEYSPGSSAACGLASAKPQAAGDLPVTGELRAVEQRPEQTLVSLVVGLLVHILSHPLDLIRRRPTGQHRQVDVLD